MGCDLDYADFKKAYFEIIKKTCNQLKPDSFACFVIGEVRDKKGNYYNFVGDTIQAFLDAGLKYYNEAILVTSVGSLPIRVGKQFESFLNHLCDGERLQPLRRAIAIFLNHLCDGEPVVIARATAATFLNHLCDGEQPKNGQRVNVKFLNHLCDGERLAA